MARVRNGRALWGNRLVNIKGQDPQALVTHVRDRSPSDRISVSKRKAS